MRKKHSQAQGAALSMENYERNTGRKSINIDDILEEISKKPHLKRAPEKELTVALSYLQRSLENLPEESTTYLLDSFRLNLVETKEYLERLQLYKPGLLPKETLRHMRNQISLLMRSFELLIDRVAKSAKKQAWRPRNSSFSDIFKSWIYLIFEYHVESKIPKHQLVEDCLILIEDKTGTTLGGKKKGSISDSVGNCKSGLWERLFEYSEFDTRVFGKKSRERPSNDLLLMNRKEQRHLWALLKKKYRDVSNSIGMDKETNFNEDSADTTPAHFAKSKIRPLPEQNTPSLQEEVEKLRRENQTLRRKYNDVRRELGKCREKTSL